MNELDIKYFETKGSLISTFFESICEKIVRDISENMQNDIFKKYSISTEKEDIEQVIPIGIEEVK